ncbi:MAG TPA: BrnA antitoxin family protein [Stellaceae bacterium]|nr:BrnA antitoxin family protein [Stellaceae bacterium]
MKHKLVRPTKAEEAAINAGMAADSDTYELTDAEFKRLRPVRGRPRSPSRKQPITIRVSPDVLAQFKAAGRGWQTRMDAALREWLKTHRVR